MGFGAQQTSQVCGRVCSCLCVCVCVCVCVCLCVCGAGEVWVWVCVWEGVLPVHVRLSYTMPLYAVQREVGSAKGTAVCAKGTVLCAEVAGLCSDRRLCARCRRAPAAPKSRRRRGTQLTAASRSPAGSGTLLLHFAAAPLLCCPDGGDFASTVRRQRLPFCCLSRVVPRPLCPTTAPSALAMSPSSCGAAVS